jgi:5,10-methylenetetrahydromethanopterin reductase
MTELAISFGTPPRRDVVDLALCAEELGYTRIWLYDSPAVYGDLWVALARIAERTERIGLGTAVAVPNLRHVMVTASAVATIEELAPGRLACAFGAGFTARKALGQKPLSWSFVKQYVQQLRSLLRGETVDVEGGACQMIHSPGFAPPRPIETPLLLAPAGPKGLAVAREVGDGIVVAASAKPGFNWCAVLASGTVLERGEDHTSPRVRAALGPWFTTSVHGVWELGGPEAVDAFPGGAEWRRAIESERPEGERHLALHEGHAVAVSERDQPLLDAAGPLLLGWGWTGDEESVRARLAEAAAEGATEILYAPGGPDIPRELAAFARAAKR